MHGYAQSDECTADTGGAGTAVGLDNVAINQNLALAQQGHVDYRAQRAADQALDFLGTAGLFAGRRFAAHAAGGGGGQHPVFGGYPTLAFAAQERGNIIFNGSGADDFGIAAFD